MRFAVIGLGQFGARLAGNLAAAGHEVIGIDKDPALVQAMRDRVTLAVAMDATDEQALRSQGVGDLDAAVVSVGGDFQAIVLATVILKQMGVPRVISRATTPISARVLARIGADEVVMPEDESADRWTHKLVSPQFLRQVELDAGHSLVEVKTPKAWVGQTLAGLKLRAEYGLHVVAIRGNSASGIGPLRMPGPTEPLHAEDTLMLMGLDEDLKKIDK
ncbi:MAG: TrkA family potassium uptake protein [Phycisphaerales bacterium]